MYRKTRAFVAASLCVLTACAAGCGPASEEDYVSEKRDELVLVRAVAQGFVIDSSALERRPRGVLPEVPLPVEAFDPQRVQRVFAETDERLDPALSFGPRLVTTGAGWHIENDSTRGMVLVSRSDLGGQPVAPPDPPRMEAAALQRLAAWGIRADEVSRVLQRQLLAQDRGDDGQVGDPVVHRHKTFVFRGIDGVPVEGHRAVVTHREDGTFQRALVGWPPLARQGHRLTSRLEVAEIERRTRETLRMAGETEGQVQLRWKYVPTLQADGTVTVELVASARLAHVDHDELTEEAQVFDIPVDAL